MINRYNDFIVESLLLRLDESVIYFSDEFVETLKRIKSEISTELLAMNSDDKDTDINYIDVTDSEDQLSFIPDAKTDDLVAKPPTSEKGWRRAILINPSRAYTTHTDMFRQLNLKGKVYQPHQIGTKGWAKDEKYGDVDIVHFKADLSNDNEQVDSVYASDENDAAVRYIDQYSEITKMTKGRNPIKVGRLVNRLLQIGGYKATDKQIEDFVNQYKATFKILKDKFRNFETVKGEDIRTYYSEDTYYSQGGSLGNSCMKYDSCQTFFQLYTENENQVKMLILLEPVSEKIKGRALLWNVELITDGGSEKITFMDRIYTNEDSDIIQFTNYAKDRGWYYKQLQQSTEIFNLEGKSSISDATLRLTFDNFKEYWELPYMDSLKFFNPDTTQASNKKSVIADYGETAWKLESQDGTNGVCRYCDNTQAIECTSCHGNGTKSCTDCNGSGETDCYFCEETGVVECTECSGNGCEECNNTGKKTCTNCDGTNILSCDSCSGDGKVDCGVCHGEGDRDCPECT
jgi:hypothetical protein